MTIPWPCILNSRFDLEGEFSTVDTAELVMGMLFAGNYHGGGVLSSALGLICVTLTNCVSKYMATLAPLSLASLSRDNTRHTEASFATDTNKRHFCRGHHEPH